MIFNTIKILITIFFITFLNFSSINALQNKVLVKIENEAITSYELKNKINTLIILSNKEVNQKNVNRLKKIAVDQLINTKMKKIELLKYDINIEESEISNYLNNVSSGNIDELKDTFKNNNLNYNLYIEEIKIQLSWQKLIYAIYQKKVNVNDIDIKNELTKILNEKSFVKEYNISEIDIILENNNKDNEKIIEIRNQIKELGFENVAKQISVSSSAGSGGNLGWLNENILSKKIYNILINLKIGDISEPIMGAKNVMFLKLNDIRTKKIENLNVEELKKNIIKQKTNELFSLYSNNHLSKIKNSLLVEYK
tara:strand:- start:7228 stop:8160 length:933 start_codon:yes stop_codon:yes gene_type:complete